MSSAVPRVTDAQVKAAGSVTKLVVGLIETIKDTSKTPMEIKEKAVAALRSLALQAGTRDEGDDTFTSCAALIASQGLPPLVELAGTGSSVAQTHAAATLAIVSHNSKEHQLAIGKLGGVKSLVTLLKSGGSGAQEQAAAAIAAISAAAENKEPLVKAGATLPLVSLLGARHSSAAAQLHASEAVGNLASLAEAQGTVQQAGGVLKLIRLLESGKAQELAARALAKLAHENMAIQAEVCVHDGIKALLALLSGLNVEAQTQAASAVAELAQGVEGKPRDRRRTQDAIAKAGGIGPLLQMVESRYPQAVAESVNALAQVSRGNRPNQDTIAMMDGLRPLTELLLPTRAEGGPNPPLVQVSTRQHTPCPSQPPLLVCPHERPLPAPTRRSCRPTPRWRSRASARGTAPTRVPWPTWAGCRASACCCGRRRARGRRRCP